MFLSFLFDLLRFVIEIFAALFKTGIIVLEIDEAFQLIWFGHFSVSISACICDINGVPDVLVATTCRLQ